MKRPAAAEFATAHQNEKDLPDYLMKHRHIMSYLKRAYKGDYYIYHSSDSWGFRHDELFKLADIIMIAPDPIHLASLHEMATQEIKSHFYSVDTHTVWNAAITIAQRPDAEQMLPKFMEKALYFFRSKKEEGQDMRAGEAIKKAEEWVEEQKPAPTPPATP